MEENTTLSRGSNNTVVEKQDFYSIAMSNIMYKIGTGIDKSYFLVLLPVGVVGNLLSFLVMMQKHNRQMSISLYISLLAVADTIVLLSGFTAYLNSVHNMEIPTDQHWFCVTYGTIIRIASLAGTFFIVSMTFDRFYSIIRPHKAASFNTVKRAKITIICIIIISIVIGIPQAFTITNQGKLCTPIKGDIFSDVYYWVSFAVRFAFPYVGLLVMNGMIIHTLRTRSRRRHSQGQTQGQGQSLKSSEKQIYTILILIAFSYLILHAPMYSFTLYTMLVDYAKTPESFAGFYLFSHVMRLTYFSNFGINFFLYVISGNKFRSDLMNLFKCFKRTLNENSSSNSAEQSNTKSSTIEGPSATKY